MQKIDDCNNKSGIMKTRFTDDNGRFKKAFFPLLLLGTLFWVFVLPDIMGFERWPNKRNLYTEPCCITAGADSMYIVRDYIIDNISAGSLPHWLPTEFMGIPIALQYCWQIYNPLEWLWWIDVDAWRTLVLWLYLFSSGLGLYAVMRKHFNSSGPAGLSAAFIYCLTGWAIWHYTYWYYITILLPIPLVLHFSLNLLKKRNIVVAFIGLTFSTSLILLNGQPQSIFCCGLGIIALMLLFVARTAAKIPNLYAGLSLLVAAAALAVAITSWQTIPFALDQLRGETWSQHMPEIHLRVRKTGIVNLFKLTSPYLRGTEYNDWFVNPALTYTVSEDFVFSLGVSGTFLLLVAAFGVFLPKTGAQQNDLTIPLQQW